jgi:hypothetical protein
VISTTTTLSEQVGDAAGLLGLLLALVTLFTNEQAKRFNDERGRQGGPRPDTLRSIRWICLGLSLVTGGAILSLAPLVRDVIGTVGGTRWEPVLGVFVLTYLLLLALLSWQARLFVQSR